MLKGSLNPSLRLIRVKNCILMGLIKRSRLYNKEWLDTCPLTFKWPGGHHALAASDVTDLKRRIVYFVSVKTLLRIHRIRLSAFFKDSPGFVFLHVQVISCKSR